VLLVVGGVPTLVGIIPPPPEPPMFTRPLTAIPAQRSSAALVKLKVALILGSAMLAALLGVVSLVAWIAFTPEVPSVEDLLPRGGAHARAVAEDFLAGRKTSVPVAERVGPDFGAVPGNPMERRGSFGHTSLTVAEVTPMAVKTDSGVREFEVHRFLVSREERLFWLDITLLLTDEGPVLGALPSLGPVPAQTKGHLALDYSDLDQAPLPNHYTAVVTAWGTHFAANEPDKLWDVVVKDETSDRQLFEYVGLGGFSAGDLQIRSVVGIPGGGYLVRVQLLLRPEGADGASVSTEYDLRLTGNDSSARVVAWGPPGSGPTLAPFTNLTPRSRQQQQ
jgi:hypothetical protein